MVHHCSFTGADKALPAIFVHRRVLYHQRRHQSLDYVSPADDERSLAVALSTVREIGASPSLTPDMLQQQEGLGFGQDKPWTTYHNQSHASAPAS